MCSSPPCTPSNHTIKAAHELSSWPLPLPHPWLDLRTLVNGATTLFSVSDELLRSRLCPCLARRTIVAIAELYDSSSVTFASTILFKRHQTAPLTRVPTTWTSLTFRSPYPKAFAPSSRARYGFQPGNFSLCGLLCSVCVRRLLTV
jgi:hypothetical protein